MSDLRDAMIRGMQLMGWKPAPLKKGDRAIVTTSDKVFATVYEDFDDDIYAIVKLVDQDGKFLEAKRCFVDTDTRAVDYRPWNDPRMIFVSDGFLVSFDPDKFGHFVDRGVAVARAHMTFQHGDLLMVIRAGDPVSVVGYVADEKSKGTGPFTRIACESSNGLIVLIPVWLLVDPLDRQLPKHKKSLEEASHVSAEERVRLMNYKDGVHTPQGFDMDEHDTLPQGSNGSFSMPEDSMSFAQRMAMCFKAGMDGQIKNIDLVIQQCSTHPEFLYSIPVLKDVQRFINSLMDVLENGESRIPGDNHE